MNLPTNHSPQGFQQGKRLFSTTRRRASRLPHSIAGLVVYNSSRVPPAASSPARHAGAMARNSPCGQLSRRMPPLTELAERIAADPDWGESYRNALPAGQRLARAIHLVHVTGQRPDRPPEDCVAFERLLLDAPHEIPTSEHLVYCSGATRKAEDLIGLGRSAYFFAGRACQDFGDVALAFSAECEAGHTGSVTPFDTGGLILGHIHGNLPTSKEERARFGQESVIALDGWRTAFGNYIAAYFPDCLGYWTGRPTRLDPEQLYQQNTDWRAWTFEVRFSEGHPICQHLIGWSVREAYWNELFLAFDSSPRPEPGGKPSVLERFLQIDIRNRLVGDSDVCGRMERWIRKQLGL